MDIISDIMSAILKIYIQNKEWINLLKDLVFLVGGYHLIKFLGLS